MKTLIAFYSRTDITRQVALNLKDMLDADIEEVKDTDKRAGIIGYLKSGFQASRKKLTTLEELKYDHADYELVIIGTPVWAGKMSIPIRTYLHQNQEIKNLAVFSTYGGSGLEGTIKDLADYTGKTPLATLGLRKKTVEAGEYQDELEEFKNKLI
ncbi:MAG: hypothetical protein Q8M92_05570 [Candidatus Subteraquimicrobiales bacterium]|nr:hypothetical protein [Candidatus Subteraquimicrobiales bacterium]